MRRPSTLRLLFVAIWVNPMFRARGLTYPSGYRLIQQFPGGRLTDWSEFTTRGIRLSEPELFVPFSYPVWPHPENRKPSECVNEHNGDITPVIALQPLSSVDMPTKVRWPLSSKLVRTGDCFHSAR